MKTLRAQVVKGRYVIEQPSTHAEGAVVELLVLDEPVEEADISGPEHAELRAALAESEAEFESGRGCSLEELVASRKIVSLGRR